MPYLFKLNNEYSRILNYLVAIEFPPTCGIIAYFEDIHLFYW